MNKENVFMFVFAYWADISNNFIADSWKKDNWIYCQPMCQKCEQNVFYVD